MTGRSYGAFCFLGALCYKQAAPTALKDKDKEDVSGTFIPCTGIPKNGYHPVRKDPTRFFLQGGYSSRSATTGLAVAALYTCVATVSMAVNKSTPKVMTKGVGPSGMW